MIKYFLVQDAQPLDIVANRRCVLRVVEERDSIPVDRGVDVGDGRGPEEPVGMRLDVRVVGVDLAFHVVERRAPWSAGLPTVTTQPRRPLARISSTSFMSCSSFAETVDDRRPRSLLLRHGPDRGTRRRQRPQKVAAMHGHGL